MKSINKAIAILLALCIIINSTSGYAYAATTTTDVNNALIRCESVSPNNLQNELSSVIQTSFDREINIDIKQKVNTQWDALKLDDVIDSEIDNAVSIVNSKTDLGTKVQSNWNKDKIREITNEIVKLAFDSPSSQFSGNIGILSQRVAAQVSQQVESFAVNSSVDALDCVQKFISSTYSPAMLNAFEKHLRSLSEKQDFSIDYKSQNPSLTDVNSSRFARAGGVALYIMARGKVNQIIEKTIIKRLSGSIGERLFGRLFVGLEGGIFGEVIAALTIIWDAAKGLEGAVPTIQAKLKAPELKAEIRQKIVGEFESGLKNDSSQIAGVIANAIYSEWLGFKEDLGQVLEVAKTSPKFRSILEKTNEVSRVKLISLVGIILNITGRSQLLEYVDDGTFERLFTLPENAYKILTSTEKVKGDKISTLIQWVDLAGNELDRVISTELYKHLSPQDLDRKTLTNILAIQDPATINKLSLLEPADIRKLLVVSKQDIIALSNRLSPDNLQIIANYLDGLEQIEINRVVKFLLDERMPDSNSLGHIVQSNNINAAIQFWKQPSFVNGILGLAIGNISWQLFMDKYGGLIIIPILIVLVPILSIMFVVFNYFRPKNDEDSTSQEPQDTIAS